jgi:hypothetical protein
MLIILHQGVNSAVTSLAEGPVIAHVQDFAMVKVKKHAA